MESRNPVRLVTPVHAENSEPLEEQISHKFTQNTDRVDFKVPMVEPADEELNEENEYGDYTEAKETEQEAALYQQIPHDGSEFEPTKDEYSSICGFENYSYLRKSQVWHCVEDIVMSYECIYDTDVR
uniref:Uncharacterized protein n=1 Tax=Amphimedon queenslandica TaxID=400682 RepID=A0A1X7SHH3_AMPQE